MPMETDAINKKNSKEVKLPLAVIALEDNSKKRLLFDLSSKQIRGISTRVFPNASCMLENGGWLLMVQHKPCYSDEQTIFLVHPSASRRVNPPARHSFYEGLFVFYVDSREAPLVVACIEIMCGVPTVHITSLWMTCQKHMYRFVRRTTIDSVALLGKEAVCIDSFGRILIFNIAEMTWRMTFCPEWDLKDIHFLTASDGEVVLISCTHPYFHTFKLFKLDMEALEWSPLDDGELDNSSWFLHEDHSFRVEEDGKRKIQIWSGWME